LLLRSEEPLKAGNGFGPAGGQRGGPGADAGQDDQRGGQVGTAVAAGGRVVGCQLGQHGKLRLGLAEQRHPRECAGQRCGQRHDHVMVTAQVGAFVGENGTELPWGEGGEGAGRDHDLVPAAGQAVDGRSVVVDDHDARLIAWAPGGGHQGGVLAPVAPAAAELAGCAASRPQHHRGGHQRPATATARLPGTAWPASSTRPPPRGDPDQDSGNAAVAARMASTIAASQDTGSTSHKVMASPGERAAQGPRSIAGASIPAAAAYRANSTAAVKAGSCG
jgi:hypothetical protein